VTEPTTAPKPRRGRVKALVLQILAAQAVALARQSLQEPPPFLHPNPLALKPDPLGEAPFQAHVTMSYLLTRVVDERERPDDAPKPRPSEVSRRWLAFRFLPQDVQRDLLYTMQANRMLFLFDMQERHPAGRLMFAEAPITIETVNDLLDPKHFQSEYGRQVAYAVLRAYLTLPPSQTRAEFARDRLECAREIERNLSRELLEIEKSEPYRTALRVHRDALYKAVRALEREGLVRSYREGQDTIVGLTARGWEEAAAAGVAEVLSPPLTGGDESAT
jgi:DNA-binding transcriptional ArsR family regulator